MDITYEALRQIPSPVGAVLLELMQSLAVAFVPDHQEPPAESPPMACPHSLPERPCCAACATLQSAEAVLAEVQAGQGDASALFPRCPLEERVLEAVWRAAPLPVTPRQVGEEIGCPHKVVQKVLQALATLGTIDHPRKGEYRYLGTE